MWVYPLWSVYVNSEGIETLKPEELIDVPFESSVNSEGIETSTNKSINFTGLRAV